MRGDHGAKDNKVKRVAMKTKKTIVDDEGAWEVTNDGQKEIVDVEGNDSELSFE